MTDLEIQSWKRAEDIWLEQEADLKAKISLAKNTIIAILKENNDYVNNIRPLLENVLKEIENDK